MLEKEKIYPSKIAYGKKLNLIKHNRSSFKIIVSIFEKTF